MGLQGVKRQSIQHVSLVSKARRSKKSHRPGVWNDQVFFESFPSFAHYLSRASTEKKSSVLQGRFLSYSSTPILLLLPSLRGAYLACSDPNSAGRRRYFFQFSMHFFPTTCDRNENVRISFDKEFLLVPATKKRARSDNYFQLARTRKKNQRELVSFDRG